MKLVLDIVTAMSVGLMIGTEFTVFAFVNPIVKKLGDASRADATRLFAKTLGAAMPFWYGANLVLLMAEAMVARHQPGMVFVVAANILWAAVIVLTLIFLVPINNRIANMGPDGFTDELRRQHKTWDTLHRWRVLALSTAMALMVIGIRV